MPENYPKNNKKALNAAPLFMKTTRTKTEKRLRIVCASSVVIKKDG